MLIKCKLLITEYKDLHDLVALYLHGLFPACLTNVYTSTTRFYVRNAFLLQGYILAGPFAKNIFPTSSQTSMAAPVLSSFMSQFKCYSREASWGHHMTPYLPCLYHITLFVLLITQNTI